MTEPELKLIVKAAIIGDKRSQKMEIEYLPQWIQLMYYRQARKKDFILYFSFQPDLSFWLL